MKSKRFIALLTVMMLCVSILGACSDGASSQAASSSAPAAQSSSAASSSEAAAPADEGGYADYTGGFPDKVTLEIPVYDRAFEGWDVTNNYYTNWAQSEFGDKYNIELKYVAIGRSTEVADYQQMLASHTAPTVIMHYDYPQALAYYSEGVMQELDWGEIQNYAPSLWKYTGSAVEQYGTVNGEKVFFFAERPTADNYTYVVRKDWVEAAGYKVEDINSLEKLNEMLLKWKEMGLGKMTHRLLHNNFTYSYPFRDFPMDEKEHTLYSELSIADFTSKATEDYLRNLNYQYNQGILDPEFYLRDDETKEKAEFAAGRTGVVSTYLAANTDIITATLANDPKAEFAILPTAFLSPADKKPQTRGYWPFGMIMSINYEATDSQRIAMWMYLEWLSQPDVLMKWQNGVEGETYNLNEEGLAVRVADYSGEFAQSANNNKDYWCLVVEGMRYDSEDLFWKANRQAWAPPGYEYLADDIIKYYKDTAPYRVPDAMFTTIIKSVGEYKADLNELWKQQYVKIVTVPEDQFDAAYQEGCQLFLSSGYQAILDEKQAAIDAGNYIP